MWATCALYLGSYLSIGFGLPSLPPLLRVGSLLPSRSPIYYLHPFRTITEHVHSQGRAMSVVLTDGSGCDNLIITNLHIEPNHSEQDKRRLLKQLAQFYKQYNNYVIFMAGDFNYVIEGDYRFDCLAGKAVSHRCAMDRYFQ